MINLKQKVQDLIDCEMLLNANSLLENLEFQNSLIDHEPTVKKIMAEYLCTTPDHPFITHLIEESFWWLDESLNYVSACSPNSRDNEISFMSVGEIEVDRETLKTYHKLDITKKSIRNAINDNTDLYISDNGYGYISTDYDYVAVDLDLIDWPLMGDTYQENN